MADTEVFENDAVTIVVATVDGQNNFAYDFLVYEAAALRAVFQPASGAEVILDLGVTFSVAGLGQENGGSITLIGDMAGVALLGDQVLMYRSTPVQRLFDYQVAGDFRAETVNRELDLMIMIDQEARRDIDRSAKAPLGSSPLTIYPGPDGSIALYDADGNLVPGPLFDTIAALIGVEAGRALVYPELPADPVYDAGGRRIGELADGVDPTDAVTLQQLEAATAGGSGDATVADPMDYGAVGDGVANDTAAVLAAFNSGKPHIRITGKHSCGLLTLPAANTIRSITGTGELKQRALGTNLLTGTDLSDLLICTNLRGAALPNTLVAASSNDGITLIDCDRVRIDKCFFDFFLFRPIIAMGGTEIFVTDNIFSKCAVGPRFMGVKRSKIDGNSILGKCLVDAEFTTGPGLESTDGNAYPVCEDIRITNNLIRDLVNCQGVLVHGGIRVTCSGNHFINCTIAISFNPYNTLDYINYPVITDNLCECYDGAWSFGSGTGGSGIVVQAGPASGGGMTPNIFFPIIANNIVVSGNRSKLGSNEGGMQLSYLTGGVVTGNTIAGSGGNAIVLLECPRINITANSIETVLDGAGAENNGVKAISGVAGLFNANMVYGCSVGVRYTGNPNFVPGANQYSSVTTPGVGP